MSEDDLKEAERFAALLFDNEELAIILETTPEAIRVAIDQKSPLGIAIIKGRLTCEAELRQSILDLAKRGSSPAQAMGVDFLNRIRR